MVKIGRYICQSILEFQINIRQYLVFLWLGAQEMIEIEAQPLKQTLSACQI